MSLTKSSVDYHMRMECNNDLNNDIKMNDNSENSRLSYKIFQEQANHVSIVTDSSNNILNKCVINKYPIMNSSYVWTVHPTLGSPYSDSMTINIQLLYNPNASMESGIWDGSFHSISLYGSIEYIALDTKNIKGLLNFMARYIANKHMDSLKANNLDDFINISKVV